MENLNLLPEDGDYRTIAGINKFEVDQEEARENENQEESKINERYDEADMPDIDEAPFIKSFMVRDRQHTNTSNLQNENSIFLLNFF